MRLMELLSPVTVSGNLDSSLSDPEEPRYRRAERDKVAFSLLGNKANVF